MTPGSTTDLPAEAAGLTGRPRWVRLGLGLVVVAVVSIGCGQGETTPAYAAPEVPYADAAEVSRLVAESGSPTVLEFCVPVGCFRCDEMRPRINELAEAEAGRLTVRRVNLHQEPELAARWGVTVCPSYVVLAGGQELGRAQYPTSADLIATMIPPPAATN